MDDDHARTTELLLDGWTVIVVTAAHGEKETVGRICRALVRSGWQPEGPGSRRME